MRRLSPIVLGLMLAGCTPASPAAVETAPVVTLPDGASLSSLPSNEDEWRAILTPEEFYILREEGTERPFTSPLNDEHRAGTFVTADCGDPVFRSEQKFDSGTGWPSFWAPIEPDAVIEVADDSLGVRRTEIRSRCGGHLGHVFDDGPDPTGLRYCMNGLALKFIPDEE